MHYYVTPNNKKIRNTLLRLEIGAYRRFDEEIPTYKLLHQQTNE